MNEEWDWPPAHQRHPAPVIEGRITRETVILRRPPPQRTFADRFLGAVILLWKVAIASALGIVVVGCAWLIGAVLRAP